MKVIIHNNTPYKLQTIASEYGDTLHIHVHETSETVSSELKWKPYTAGHVQHIIVNGTVHSWSRLLRPPWWYMKKSQQSTSPSETDGDDFVTYEIIAALAGFSPDRAVSITYKGGTYENPEGILTSDGSVRVKDGISFRVVATSGA